MQSIAVLEGVTKRFGAKTAVTGLDLVIPKGGIYALLGPNGAGKTTTINLLLGLLKPDAGRLEVLGRRPGEMDARRAIGAMLQVGGVPTTLTVRELIELFSGYYPRPRAFAETVAMAGLAGLENHRFGRLSGGQKQRVLFALAVCGSPELLFLDEPTVGMDVEMRRLMWDVVRGLADSGCTIILTTHYLEEADALADRIGVIAGGRLVTEGTPAEIKSVVGGRKLRCTTALSDSVIEGIEGVCSLVRRGGTVELVVDRAESVLREMLSMDPSLSDLEVTGAGLDEAFLSLVADAKEAA